MNQKRCRWCGEPDPEETLAISPGLNLYQLIDAIVEAAAEQPRNGKWCEKHEVRTIGGREPEVIGESVHPNSVLTLGEVKKAINQVDHDDMLRSKAEMPVCERCAESIKQVDEDHREP